jgi:hypothetical protein
MKNYKVVWFIFLLVISGCATAVTPAREAFILARPHGWIELTIVDDNVPAIPVKDDNTLTKAQAPRCSIVMSINGENYLSEQILATGDNTPFSINTGFRIAVPAGNALLKLNYIGCKVEKGRFTNYITKVNTTVAEDFITSLSFDGMVLSTQEQRRNEYITLEAIDARLKRIESSIESMK